MSTKENVVMAVVVGAGVFALMGWAVLAFGGLWLVLSGIASGSGWRVLGGVALWLLAAGQFVAAALMGKGDPHDD
jgi:hypothetical protein